MKIGLLCSKGGHLQEMMNIKDAWGKYDHFFVTYKSERIKYLDERKYLVVDPMDGGIKYLFTLARALCKVFGERPDVLISTTGKLFSGSPSVNTLFLQCGHFSIVSFSKCPHFLQYFIPYPFHKNIRLHYRF